MALIVPDESLATAAEANAYHEGRGNVAAWSPLETEYKEQLLRRGHDYLLAVYGAAWPAGEPFGTVGGVVPDGMRKAAAVMALKAKDGDLLPEVVPQLLREKIGPIESEYAEAKGDGLRRFPEVERLVAPYLAPAPNPYMIRLERS